MVAQEALAPYDLVLVLSGDAPLITPATKSPLALSFWNLVELYVLASLRRRYEVPMPKVRSALRYTARELGAQFEIGRAHV